MIDSELFPFENTEIYRKAYAFTKQCRNIIDRLPGRYYSDKDQLRRSSLSILNNYAEGYGRWGKKDKQQFYTISKGSAYECVPVISLLYEEKQILKSEFSDLRSQLKEINKMLSGIVQGLEKRKTI